MGSIESEPIQPSMENLNYYMFQSNIKDFVIFILLVTLVLSILGINIFIYMGYLVQYLSDLFKPFLATIGYATGTTINRTADLAGDTAKFSVDVAEGAVQDIGNLMISATDKKIIPNYEEQYKKVSSNIFQKMNDLLSSSMANIPSLFQITPVGKSPSEQEETTTSTTIPEETTTTIPEETTTTIPEETTTTIPEETTTTQYYPPQYQQQYPMYGMTPMGANMPITFPVTITIPVPVPINIAASPSANIEKIIESPPPAYAKEIKTDQSESNIQSPISSKKTNWCLIGEYKDRKGCVEIDDADRCISGQVFPSKQMCMNPIFNLDSANQDVFKTPSNFVATDDRAISSNQLFVS